jgi:hypothetical protein
MIRNNTSFSLQITSKIKELYSIYSKDLQWKSLLDYYQYIVKNVIINPLFSINDSRGLLIYFTMGLGKTRTAVSIAISVDMPVLVILPKSLQQNFEDTMKFIERDIKPTKNKINFISMDAYNSINQLERTGQLNGKLIIIDEAHNFFRAIINGNPESNAFRMYEQIMNAKNIKLIFLTGTPISKDPFELVPCINMLSSSKTGTGNNVLPIYYTQFNDLYVDLTKRTIRNKEFLANRLLGLVSYATVSDSQDKSNGISLFPVEFPIIISYVEMSAMQYRKYLQVREKEEINKKKQRQSKSSPMSLPKQTSMSSYYVMSRSISNYVDSLNPKDKITNENSPKLALIAQRVNDCKGIAMVYSQFVNSHGLKQLIYYLNEYGFVEYSGEKNNKTYAFFTGETKSRDTIISIVNSDENKHGNIIKVLLISKTGAEGLNLKNIRETHQIEPYWDYARTNQVKARAVRYMSHMTLPELERNVQPYIYISTANKEIWSQLKEREEQTIEEMFYKRAVEKHIINTEFNKLLQSVAIECSYFKMDNCYICEPTNIPLFTDDPIIDVKISNPCILYKEEEKEANRITINNNEYYYTVDPLHVYKYDVLLDGYVEIDNEEIIEYIKQEMRKM